jgi:hypothetical protein
MPLANHVRAQDLFDPIASSRSTRKSSTKRFNTFLPRSPIVNILLLPALSLQEALSEVQDESQSIDHQVV